MFSYRPLLVVCILAYVPLSLCAHVFFEINLTWETRAPDGQPRNVILINGQFPGPQLNLDYGDDVEVGPSFQSQPQLHRIDCDQFVVHNNLPFDSTVHFHGIEYVGKKSTRRTAGRDTDEATGNWIRHGRMEPLALPRNPSSRVEASPTNGQLLSTVPIGKLTRSLIFEKCCRLM